MEIVTFEDDIRVYAPTIFNDDRGCFFESVKDTIIETKQANVSVSNKNVFRGLHYQSKDKKQAKFLKVLRGSIIDIVLNIDMKSPNYGKYYLFNISDYNRTQLYIPGTFAHGFVSLDDNTTIEYNVDNYYCKEEDRCINIFSVPGLVSTLNPEGYADDWIISPKDRNAISFEEHKKNNFFE
jgi:dTDP-4-dehydrorhamnose 3,5-epimerase